MREPMTKVQVIETACKRLIKQGKWATKPGMRRCMYLTPTGEKCAIGLLPGFPKECQTLDEGVESLWELFPKFRALFAGEVGPNFLHDVQCQLHDCLCFDQNASFSNPTPLPFSAKNVKDAAARLLARVAEGSL